MGQFSLDLSRLVEKAKGRTDTVVKTVMLEAFSKVVMKSPVGNPSLWAANATAVEYNDAVTQYNHELRQDPANLTKNGRLKRGLKSHDSMAMSAGKDYVGGRFRANWTAAQGSYDRTTTTDIDPKGSATIGRIAAAIRSMKLDGKTIYLTNSLSYSIKLEHGWSKQSPQGVVKLTLAEISAIYGR